MDTRHFNLLTCVALLLCFFLGQSRAELQPPQELLRRQRKCFEGQKCIMLLNEKGSAGCAQCRGQAIRADLKVLESPDKLDEITADSGIIIARESTALRSQGLLRRLITTDAGKADAVILAQVSLPFENDSNTEARVEHPPVEKYSGDSPIPNEDYIYKVNDTLVHRPKNTYATGLQQSRFPFNVFYLSQEEAEELRILNDRFKLKGRFSPRFRVQSEGQMEACPRDSGQQSGPSPSPPIEAPTQTEILQESTNATVCLKDRTCVPIGGYSAWSSISKINSTTFNKTGSGLQIVAVTAPMDSTALFHDMAYGASAEMASVAALMAIVKAVGNYARNTNRQPVRHPMFFAFTAQSWGFAGSGRFLDDVKNFECKEPGYGGYCNNPLAPSLKFMALKDANMTVINLGGLVDPTPRQVDPILPGDPDSGVQVNYSFFAHGFDRGNKLGNKGDAEKALSDQFAKTRRGNDLRTNLRFFDGFRDASFTDASQSFQEYAPEADVITVTNFENNFTNPFYHSPYDNASLILKESRKPLYLVAAGIAKAVIQLCFEDENPSVKEDPEVIDGILDCLTSNWRQKNCSIAQEYLPPDFYSRMQEKIVGSNYAGVFVPPDFAPTYNGNGFYKSQFLRSFMAYHTRLKEPPSLKMDITCANTTQCNKEYNATVNPPGTKPEDYTPLFCVNKKCIIAESHLHAAYGTGLNATNSARSLFNVIEATPTPSPSPSPSVDAEVSPTPVPTFELESPGNPAWTESDWKVDPQICYVIEDSDSFAGMVLGSGLATFVVSLAFAAMLNKLGKKAPAVLEVDENLLPDAQLLGPDQP